MKCKDCLFWKEKWIDREEKSACHLEPKTIRKNGDDFCGHFRPKYPDKEGEKF
jgi:hypothetical protein